MPAHHRGPPAAKIEKKSAKGAHAIGQAVREALAQTLNKAQRFNAQSGQRKPIDGQPKFYAWHAPEVDCISKGKAKQPYEFGVKMGIASTTQLQGNLIVGAKAFHGNPYDGHTLAEQLEQATILMQACQAKPQTAFIDLGYRAWMQTTPMYASCTGESPEPSAERRESCSSDAKRSSRSSGTSRATTA